MNKGLQNQPMKLSVVVPIYNVEKYIHECVNSLIYQTFKDMEIILVDDGSPDNCPSICDEYAKKRSNVRVVHKKNGGSNSARKAGVLAAQGEYIAFVDGDDWVDLTYYEDIFREVGDYSPEVIRIPQFRETTPSEEPVYRPFKQTGYFDRARLEKEVYPVLLYKPPFYNSGLMSSILSIVFKKDACLNRLMSVPDEIRTGEDLAFSVSATLDAQDAYIVGTAGYYYRQNPTSVTHTYRSDETRGLLALFNFLSGIIRPNSPFNLRYQLSMYAIYMACGQARQMMFFSENLKQDVESMSELFDHPLVKEGLRNKLPFKKRFALMCVKKKKMLMLKATKLFRR